MKRRAFTLIELVAVLVIMAILALIVTPLVMSIIKKAKLSADKRSIDAYGRSIELAIAGYLLDNGTFPTSIGELTIEYRGDEVVCSTTQLNDDSSIYLEGCTVGGKSVEGYTYGKEEATPTLTYTAYQIGDKVSYNNVTYYVIEDSSTTSDTVKLLKEEPLLKTEIDALNLSDISVHEYSLYGTLAYGSTTDYDDSTVKQVVDAWKDAAVLSGDIVTARLITYNELITNLGYDPTISSAGNPALNENVPEWVYKNYSYWTMDAKEDTDHVWTVNCVFNINYGGLYPSELGQWNMVRPVLELNKSANITLINL